MNQRTLRSDSLADKSKAQKLLHMLEPMRGWPDKCVLWPQAQSRQGYGLAWHDGGRLPAHRLSYITFVGPIPPGLLVRHKCDIRLCINPRHLEVGTNDDNVADRNDRGRQARGSRIAQAKLTEADVVRIKRALAKTPNGIGSALARQYGVDQTTISKIKRGLKWKHVALPSQATHVCRSTGSMACAGSVPRMKGE